MPDGDIVPIILWHGQYRNDGLEVLDMTLTDCSPRSAPRGLRDVRLVGEPTKWFVVADAVRYQP